MVAWFIGRIEQGPEGGTLVAGTIGPDESSQAVFAAVFAAVSVVRVLMVPIMLAVGVASLVSRAYVGLLMVLQATA